MAPGTSRRSAEVCPVLSSKADLGSIHPRRQRDVLQSLAGAASSDIASDATEKRERRGQAIRPLSAPTGSSSRRSIVSDTDSAKLVGSYSAYFRSGLRACARSDMVSLVRVFSWLEGLRTP